MDFCNVTKISQNPEWCATKNIAHLCTLSRTFYVKQQSGGEKKSSQADIKQ